MPVAGPAVAPQMSSICESTAFSGTAVRHRRCGSTRDSKAPQRQARQPLSAASPLTRHGGLAVGTSNDEASHYKGNDGDEGGGAGGQAGSGGKGGSGGGDASRRGFWRALRRCKQRVMRRGKGETAARVAKGAKAAARGGVIAIMVERYESPEIENVLLAGSEYSDAVADLSRHRSCGVDTDEADQEKPLAPPHLQFLAAFMICAIHSPMSSSATVETFQRYYDDLMDAASNVRGAQWEQFLKGVRKFKVTKPTGWCKHTTNMVKFLCDIGDDVLRQAVVATVMQYKSAKLLPPESGFWIQSSTRVSLKSSRHIGNHD